ncbi:MAG: helix-turn-helix domain-containing protein [bacterium]|nr:helix-turn-helix transcriptional regulator [Parabacteroides distasonis]MDD6078597.1 helix-turn-helix domain-containing protein [bacterium]
MARIEDKFLNIELCPIRNVIARFGNKWALLILLVLNEEGCMRFNQLRKYIPDISSKVLSGTLQILESDGLVKRTVYPEVPPRVEYQLTEMGHSLMPIIADLTQWALSNMPTIMNHREQFEQSI